jgi:hypothetical protein
MGLLDIFRDKIYSGNIKVGTILKVFPKYRSHSKTPYIVKVIESDETCFKTELFTPTEHECPHIRTFVYDSAVWVDYHCDRFKIM